MSFHWEAEQVKGPIRAQSGITLFIHYWVNVI